MMRHWFRAFLVSSLLLFVLASIAACGSGAPAAPEATAMPKAEEKMAATEAPKAEEKMEATAAPMKTDAPASAEAAGTITIAVLGTRTGSGIPRFCTAGCAETIYQIGIAETLFMSDWKDDVTGSEVEIKPRLALSWEFDPDDPNTPNLSLIHISEPTRPY